jgi:hypothetical protein
MPISYRQLRARYEVNKKVAEILNGFDRIVEKTEAMPVTPEEKRRLIKEWLRSRLAELPTAESPATDASTADGSRNRLRIVQRGRMGAGGRGREYAPH